MIAGARGDAAPASANEALRASYDAFPYRSLPFAQSHPDRLATLATLFGVVPAPLERCRVLEIGCASGGNLIPVAATLPRSRCVGVDFSSVQIAQGRADISALGLDNVELVHADLRNFDGAGEQFDYIIAHGVLSWVPREVQDRVFAVCAEMLAPQGVAYISYNALPGWQTRGAIRDAMRYHANRFADPVTRVLQARAVLDFLAESMQSDKSAYGSSLRDEATRLRQQPDFYIFHDHLEEVNEAFYFHKFMERATAHGLRYLGESEIKLMLTHDLAPNVVAMLSRVAPDLLQREQFLDFLRNQMFRQTLLVREATALNRALSPERVLGLHVATKATGRAAPEASPDAAMEYHSTHGSALKTRRALTKAAMSFLIESSPLAIAFDTVCAAAASRLALREVPADERMGLASDLLQAYAVGVVELHASASPFVLEAGDKPVASALARLQAARGAQVTNLRHEWMTLDDTARRAIAWLDGAHTRSDIAALAWPGMASAPARAQADALIALLARHALIARAE
ncbi:MAG: class I SAM-dependent methyltransferase [Betaproteobacteria bacterium]